MELENIKTGANHIIGTKSSAYLIRSNTTRYDYTSPDNGKCLDSILNTFPLSSIGFLYSHADRKISTGTGFLIGNGLVVTAAHCLYVKDGEYFKPSPSIMFGKKTGNPYSATAQIQKAYLPYQYYSQSANDGQYDWELLKLSTDNLQEEYGAMTIGSSYSLSETTYSSYGYFTPQNTIANVGLYVSTAYDVQEESGRIYKIYSYANSGMSGGPVVAYYVEPDEQDPNGERAYTVVVGINSLKSYTKNDMRNYLTATKISNELITLAEVI